MVILLGQQAHFISEETSGKPSRLDDHLETPNHFVDVHQNEESFQEITSSNDDMSSTCLHHNTAQQEMECDSSTQHVSNPTHRTASEASAEYLTHPEGREILCIDSTCDKLSPSSGDPATDISRQFPLSQSSNDDITQDDPHYEDMPYFTVDKGIVSKKNLEKNADTGPTSSLVPNSPSSLPGDSTTNEIQHVLYSKEDFAKSSDKCTVQNFCGGMSVSNFSQDDPHNSSPEDVPQSKVTDSKNNLEQNAGQTSSLEQQSSHSLSGHFTTNESEHVTHFKDDSAESSDKSTVQNPCWSPSERKFLDLGSNSAKSLAAYLSSCPLIDFDFPLPDPDFILSKLEGPVSSDSDGGSDDVYLVEEDENHQQSAITSRQRNILSQAFREWPLPFPSLVSQLSRETGLARQVVVNWFLRMRDFELEQAWAL